MKGLSVFDTKNYWLINFGLFKRLREEARLVFFPLFL